MEFRYGIYRPSPLRVVPYSFREARVEAELLPSHLQLRACRDPTGIPVAYWKLAQPICNREPRDEDAPGGKEAVTREIMA